MIQQTGRDSEKAEAVLVQVAVVDRRTDTDGDNRFESLTMLGKQGRE